MEKPIKYIRFKKLLKNESEIQIFLDEIIEKGLIIIKYIEKINTDVIDFQLQYEIIVVCAKYN